MINTIISYLGAVQFLLQHNYPYKQLLTNWPKFNFSSTNKYGLDFVYFTQCLAIMLLN